MIPQNRHIIQNQQFEIQLPSQEGDWAERIKAVYWQEIVPEMNRLFDQWAGPDEWLRISKLEIELPLLGGENWESHFKEHMLESISNKLKELKEQSKTQSWLAPAHQENALIEKFPQDSWTDQEPADLKHLHKSEVLWEGLHYFLKMGVLPWWLQHLSIKDLCAKLASSHHLQENLESFLKLNPIAIKRFALQIPLDFQAQFANRFSTSRQKEVARFVEALTLIISVLPSHKQPPILRIQHQLAISRLRLLIQTRRQAGSIFQAFLSGLSLDSDLSFFQFPQMLQRLPRAAQSKINEFLPELFIPQSEKGPEVDVERRPEPKDSQARNQKADLKDFTSLETPVKKDDSKPKKQDQKAAFNARKIAPEIQSINQDWHSSPRTSDLEGEAFYINHAGLVLVHPFLPTLFQALELSENQEFKGEWEQVKAVHLTGFIATGQDDLDENELLLSKLLCAWPVEKPIERMGHLNNDLKKEANLMLSALIEHWGALGNSSVEGLREAFFQRDGKLWYQAPNWELFVEHKAQDILLNRLPWGHSMIKNPWMEDMLLVHWNY